MISTVEAAAVDKVAVIGAGAGGLAAANQSSSLDPFILVHCPADTPQRYLAAEKAFSKIEVFEQRGSVGGIWNATPRETVDRNFRIPRTKPSPIPNEVVWEHEGDGNRGSFQFLSPVYDVLDTNIPHTLMNYSDQHFPKGSSLFPQHAVVREYLEQYAAEIRHLIRLGTQVLDVHPVKKGSDDKWSVKTRDIETNEETTSIFDAVVVANGHYDDPFVPAIPGIREWNAAYPGMISHSKFYRRPDAYKNKKVIIVGHSASGIDLAAQISVVSQHPLLISEKTKPGAAAPPLQSTNPSPSPATAEQVPEISEFLVQDRAIRFVNGRLETHVDHVIFCTGYMYSFPFLRTLDPPVLTSHGARAQNLYQQIFYHPLPTLSFIALPQRIVPFPVSEAQASVVARVLSGRLALPPASQMAAWEAALVAQKGSEKAFHVLGFPLDADYINFLHDWALQAQRREGLANEGVGKIPPYWTEEQRWLREQTPAIKIASRELGPERFKVKTVKELLGVDFEQWKKENGGVADHLL